MERVKMYNIKCAECGEVNIRNLKLKAGVEFKCDKCNQVNILILTNIIVGKHFGPSSDYLFATAAITPKNVPDAVYTPCVKCGQIIPGEMKTIAEPDELFGEMICKRCWDEL